MATSAKENILKKIRQALSNPVPLPFPQSEGAQSFYVQQEEDLAITFADEFIKLQGKFAFCADKDDLKQQIISLLKDKKWTKAYFQDAWIQEFLNEILPYEDLATCDVSITNCECLVARTGSIVLSSAQKKGRTASVYAPVHICIARSNEIVYDIKDALVFLKEKYKHGLPSLISFASGPSRTADIEKTLVTGVHGPKEVYCFLVEN